MADDIKLQAGIELDPQSISQLQRSFAQIEKSLKFNAPFGGFARDVNNFNSQMDRANQRVITLGASFLVLSSATRILKDVVNSTIEVQKTLTDINSVFQLSSKNLDKFSRDLFDTARATSQSFATAATAAKEFSRQGLSAQQVIRQTSDALLLARQSGLDVADAVKTITASLNGFQKEALSSGRVVNTLANLDAAFAVSSKDLADALTRVGSSAADAGVSFNQLVGLVTTAKQITGRDGAVIAGALNAIFTRINRHGTIEELESLGVVTKDLRGQVLPTLQLLENFSKVYDRLGGSIKLQAAETVGGVRNLNTLKGVLGDLSKAQSIFAQTQEIAGQTSDAARQRNEAMQKSLAALGQQFATTAQQIGANVGKFGFTESSSSALKFLINNPITKAFANAGDDPDVNTAGEKAAALFLKGFGNAVIASLGPLLIYALGGITKSTLAKVAADFSEITGLNAKAKEQQAIQSQIIALYNAGDDALKKQIISMGLLTERAAALQALLSSRNASNAYVTQEIVALSGAMAGGKKATPTFASGYVPYGAESAAIGAGVGGAPASAHPVLIHDFNFGGGQRGPIVANSSEFIVPNFAGGSAIFNQDMAKKFGLPPGAQPIAAGGYIPNAADGMYSRQDFTAKGSFVSNADVASINSLFEAIHKAGSGDEARKIGKQVIDLTTGMNKLAQGDVLSKLGREFEAFDKGLDLATIRSKIIDDDSRRALSPRPQDATGYRDYRRQEALRNIQSTINRKGGPSFDQIEDEIAAREFIGPRQAPPTLSRPGIFGRGFSSIKNSPFSGLALGFGLSALGGVIPEGRGGTASGAALGGLGSGLTLAGTGASVGSLFGGAGALVGAGGGLAVGGIYGVIKKLEGSFDEFAKTVDEVNKKLGEQARDVSEAFRLEDDIKTARKNGASSQAISELRKQQVENISAIKDQSLRDLVANGIGNPNSQREALSRLNAQSISSQKSNNLIGGFLAGNERSSTFGLFGYDNKAKEQISDSVSSSISSLSASQVKALQSLAKTDPAAAIRFLGKTSGASEEDIQSKLLGRSNLLSGASKVLSYIPGGSAQALKAGVDRANSSTLELYIKAITEATQKFEKEGLGNLSKTVIAASDSTEILTKSLESFVNGLELSGKLTQVESDRQLKLKQIEQQAQVSQGFILDRNKLDTLGGFERSNIQSQFAGNRQTTISEGAAGLAATLQKTNADSAKIREQLEKLGSLSDVQRLKAGLETVSGKEGLEGVYGTDFKNALEKLINSLIILDKTEKANLEVSRAQTEALKRQYEQEGSRGYQAQLSVADFINQSDKLDRLKSGGARYNDINQQAGVALTSGYRAKVLSGKIGELQGDVSTGSGLEGLALEKNIRDNEVLLGIAKERHYEEDKINQILLEQYDSIQKQQYANGQIVDEGKARLDRLKEIERVTKGSKFTSGGQIESAAFNVAKEQGLQGDALGSFEKGFTSRYDGLKRDIQDLSDLGEAVAKSLETNLGNAFGDFVTGAKSAKDAFRSFATSVLSEAARMLASKAIASILSLFVNAFIGGAGSGSSVGGGDYSSVSSAVQGGSTIGNAKGGIIGMASGGRVPAMVMGGEYYVGASAARRIGYGTLNAINNYEMGGLIQGGSGMRDDVPANLQRGGFVIRKSSVAKVGLSQLDSMVRGSPMHYADGGPVDVGSSGNSAVSVQISINNNMVDSKSSSQNDGKNKGFGPDFALRLERQVRGIVQEELVNQSKSDGFFTQSKRYIN